MKKLFGKNMKEIREFLGITQIDLSQRTGITPAGISMIESGQREPSFTSIVKIINALGVTFERMLKK